MSVGQGGNIYVGSSTNLPETVRQVEMALKQLSSVMGAGLPPIRLGQMDLSALNTFQQQIDKIAGVAEERFRLMQQRIARSGGAGTTIPGLTTPTAANPTGGVYGTPAELGRKIREAAYQEMNAVAGRWLSNAPAIMKTVPLGPIMESTLTQALTTATFTPAGQTALASATGPVGQQALTQLAQQQQMLLNKIERNATLTPTGVTRDPSASNSPGLRNLIFDPATVAAERAFNKERLEAAHAALAANRAVTAGGVIKVDQPFAHPVTGTMFGPGMYSGRTGAEATLGMAQQAAGALYKSQMRASHELDRLAIEAEAARRGLHKMGPFFDFKTGFTDPKTGRYYAPGTYVDSTGQRATPVQQQQFANRYAQTPLGAFLGGFTGRGMISGGQGIDPQAITNLAATAGNVAKYSLLYNMLFGIVGVMGDMINEAKNMSDSMRDLNIAIGQNADPSAQFISDLSMISRLAGTNVGEAMDTAARGVRMFASEMEDLEDIQRVGTQVAFAASQIALITNKTLPNAAGDINAVASAFGLSADSISTVVDAVSGAKNKIGGLPAEVSQGLANIAQSANEAGFTINEAAAAIALVQGRTDQSGQAVATRLSRVFSILAGTTGRGIISTLNQQLQLYGTPKEIDPDASVRDQFEQIARAYKDATPQLQGLIRSALGGSSNTKELIPILTNPDTVFGADFAEGAGLEEFKKKSEDLTGTLRKLAGSITNIQTGLVQSKIFAPFAVGLKIVEPLANALDRLLQTYVKLAAIIDDLPVISMLKPLGGLSGIATFLVEVVLMRKAFNALGGMVALRGFFGNLGTSMGKQGIFGTMGSAAMAGRAAAAGGAAGYQPFLAAAGGQAAAGMTMASRYPGVPAGGPYPAYAGMTMAQMRAQSAAANAAAAAGTTRMGALGAGIGRFAGGPVSMALAAIGVVQLADGIMTAMREIDDAAGMSQRLVGEEGYLSLIDGAKTLRSAAAGLETIQGGPSSFFVSGMRGDTTAQMENTARIWEDLQERITKESERIAKINPFGALGDFSSLTVEEFNARLETLKVNGETATSTLKMVNEELLALGQPKVIRESTTELSSITFQDLLDANAPWMGRAAMESGGPDLVRELARLQRGEELGLTPAAEAPLPLDTSVILENLFKNTPIAQNIGTGLGPYQAMMRSQGGRLTPEQSIDARAMIEEQFMMNSPELQVLNKSYPDLVQALVDQWVAFYMEGIFGEAGVATLTADMAAAVVSSQLSGLSTGLGQTNSSSERMRLIRQTQAAIANTQRETPTTTGEEALAEIEKMRFEEASKNAEAMARSDASRADTRKQGNAILTAELQRVTQQAANRGYEDTLIGYFNAASKAQVEMIMDTARTTFLAAKAKRDADLASAQSIAEAAAIMQQFEGDKTTWRTFRKAFQRAFPQKEGDWEIPKDDEADSGITLAEAKRAAAAARAGGSLVPAQMELKNATEALRKVKGHGIKYYEALADWYNAQRALRDAIASFRDTQFRLGIDLTNPLAVAKADLRKAQAKLRSDQRAGAGPDVIAQDKLDVQNQQNQVEATKFSQRFSRMQTAEQLGRISHAAYMRYLDNERERLENVKKKTHQQWEQLNQIEQAQKSMRDGFNKMFNLGDIKMPTPYEVRRYMQSTAMPVQQTNGNTTNVYIDGADLGKVYNYLTQQWGSVVMATAGTSTSKT